MSYPHNGFIGLHNPIAKMFLLAFMLIASSLALAAQKIPVDDGKSYSIKISQHEASRIAVDKGRIVRAWSMNTNWQVKEDKDAGEIYIKPATGTRKAFSFFIQDNFGNTYTLIALPQDTPSETIILQPTKRIKNRQSNLSNQPYIQRVKNIIKDMANADEGNYVVTSLSEIVPLWRETEIRLIRRFEVNELLGEIYQVRNISGGPMVFAEQEFSNFGDNVLAVALERTLIEANDEGLLYIVRGEEDM